MVEVAVPRFFDTPSARGPIVKPLTRSAAKGHVTQPYKACSAGRKQIQRGRLLRLDIKALFSYVV